MTVRTGRVNGLPCVQVRARLQDIEYVELWQFDGPAGVIGFTPWTAGFPDYWPRRPTQQCLDCGMENDETKVGHFCTGGEYEKGDEVEVVAPEMNIVRCPTGALVGVKVIEHWPDGTPKRAIVREEDEP